VKDIGKPDAGKLHVRFDEGRLINDQSGGHVVAACGKASAKVPDQWSDISFLLYPKVPDPKGALFFNQPSNSQSLAI
jgi:hypothetical protein